MSTFDPTKHPRGNQSTGHAGQFATKQQTGAEVSITDDTRYPNPLTNLRNAFADGDFTIGAAIIENIRNEDPRVAVNELIRHRICQHTDQFVDSYPASVSQYGEPIPDSPVDALDELGAAMASGDLQRAGELEAHVRSLPPEQVVDKSIRRAVAEGVDGYVAPGRHEVERGVVKVGDRTFYDADLYQPQEPYAMRLEFDHDLTWDEVQKIAGLVGYQYRSSVAGESIGEPVKDTNRSIILDADTTKSARSDPQAALREFQEQLPNILAEGSPVRKTNSAGPDTKGTRLIDGIGSGRVKLFWEG